jgi:hypothetical protein
VRFPPLCFTGLIVPLLGTAQEARPRPQWSAVAQTGLASTFQLTLGGEFGAGPAWQNRLTVARHDVFAKGDQVSVWGWKTLDLPGRHVDWMAGAWYRPKVWRGPKQTVWTTGAGLQRWRFPSVLKGTQDWLAAADVAMATTRKHGPWFQSEYWYSFHSNRSTGPLLYSQGGLRHHLVRRDDVSFVLKHGPTHTHGWGLFGCHGRRVVRYEAIATLRLGSYTVEAMVRPQFPLRDGIPHTRYWGVTLARAFGR